MVVIKTKNKNHFIHRVGWLRAAVLGANDGIVSTSSLIVGVAAANSSHHNILIAGIAGLIAGAMSMAAGEYVSVSSQTDTENADLLREHNEHLQDIVVERKELANIYERRGLTPMLAKKVANQLMKYDALGSHARDELGISEEITARPLQAAFASAATFSIGAVLPLIIAFAVPYKLVILAVSLSSVFFLILLGSLAAYTGGANIGKGAFRVTFWGIIAMALTAGIGTFFGVK